MKQLIASRTLAIPDGVSIEVKARKVRVKGPRGELPCRCLRSCALLPSLGWVQQLGLSTAAARFLHSVSITCGAAAERPFRSAGDSCSQEGSFAAGHALTTSQHSR